MKWSRVVVKSLEVWRTSFLLCHGPAAVLHFRSEIGGSITNLCALEFGEAVGKYMSYIRVSQSGLRWRPSGPNFPTIFYLFVVRVRFCFRKSWRTGTSSRKCIWNASDFYRHDVVHWTAKRCAKNIKIAQGWGKNDVAIIPLAHGCEVLFKKCAVLIWFLEFKGRRWMLEHEGRVKIWARTPERSKERHPCLINRVLDWTHKSKQIVIHLSHVMDALWLPLGERQDSWFNSNRFGWKCC